jgi:hypothetical protein
MRWGLRPLAVGCWLALFHTLARGAAPEATTLAWRAEDGVRLAPLTVPQGGRAGFSHVLPAATGIVFTNLLADARSATNRNLLSGAGVAAGDIDGDGWCDLYLCGLDGDNALYRNLGGWKFADITAKAGVACPGQDSTGAAFADFDGDGDLDLIVTGLGHGVRLFVNDGRGGFQETTSNAGLGSRTGSMSCAIADVDGDGGAGVRSGVVCVKCWRQFPAKPTTESALPHSSVTTATITTKPITSSSAPCRTILSSGTQPDP